MNRTFLLLLAACVMGNMTPAAHADWEEWKIFWHNSKTDYYRVKAWPAPFNFVDRDQVHAPLAAMTAKGWQRQNTIGRFYFNSQTQELTEAGQLKLHAILTQNPPEFRTVFVVRSQQPEESERRIQRVQQFAQKVAGPGVEVVPTATEPHGWSAEYINAIDNKMLQSLPNPVLPQYDAGGGS